MATEILDHWVAGKTFTGASTRTSPVYNPARGVVQREVRLATTADVDAAVQAAKSAFPAWADASWAKRTAVMFASVVGVPAVAIAGYHLGAAYVAGLVGFYGVYEWLHRREHTHAGIGPYGRWARRHHFHHHFVDGRTNHGVTSPIWDLVFRVEDLESMAPYVQGDDPVYYGLVNDARQIAIMALHNNDLANFWEWYGSPAYPLKPATDAFRMGTNFVVHAMTH